MKEKKIVIIGTGHVGSQCAYALASQGIAREIVLIDKDMEKAKSHAMDIADCGCFQGREVLVRTGKYKDVEDADIIVVSIGVSRKPGQTRLDMLDASVACADEMLEHMRGLRIPGIIISISNPADIIADYIRKKTDLPKNRVFSTGTSLDTARMRRTVGDLCKVSPRSVIGFAMGEHGDSSMVPFSHLTIQGKSYAELKEEKPERFGKLDEEYIIARTHLRGMDIVIGKGSTEFGIASALADIAKAVLMDEKRVMPVSPLLEGEYGQSGIHAGVPCVIGKNGVEEILELRLCEEEKKAFDASCDIIREYASRIKK